MADFKFIDLNNSVRNKMQKEINLDNSNNCLYLSKRFTKEGETKYLKLLLEAAIAGTEKTLTNSIEPFIELQEIINGKIKKTPLNAASLFCQGEFNRFYIRAICLESIELNNEFVEVYRARESSRSRPESEKMIGTKINARELLNDLRKNIGINPKLLPEVNSGLSVKIIDK